MSYTTRHVCHRNPSREFQDEADAITEIVRKHLGEVSVEILFAVEPVAEITITGADVLCEQRAPAWDRVVTALAERRCFIVSSRSLYTPKERDELRDKAFPSQ
jgi:hypothetical protein